MLTPRRGRERQREFFTGRLVSSLSAGEGAAAHTAGYEPGTDGGLIGRDPRSMTADDLRLMGHEPLSPMEAIRARCLDCCGGSVDEVRKCVAMACVSWPFRLGKNPWRRVSEARREVGRQLAARRHQKSSDPSQHLVASDEEAAGGKGVG